MDFNDILDSLPMSIYRVDADHKITYVNEVIRQQLGLPEAEIIGKTAYDFYPEELAKKYHDDDVQVFTMKTELRTVEEHWLETESRMTYVEVIKQPILDELGVCVGIQGIYSDVSGIREKLIDAEHRAMTDPLTELPNRKAIELQLHNYSAKTSRDNYCFTLVFVDLNNFKKINDKYGHIAGDQVLVEVANRLLRVTRGNDVVGRFAGDEFVLILDGTCDKDTFIQWHQRADKEMSKPIRLPNSDIEVTVSISVGACLCPQKTLNTTEAMLDEADKMMYLAKSDKEKSYYISGY